ncbi:MAG: methylated-DNA--[protein]-cysteine S-methyltransferase [Planctomycetes bacterium]|nr:methylated-DNA--[protein]-cysteine S-methyltransferase [Planctomycetota bacterium]MCH9727681.1 methylated-DNA--[protein]-cysteine S-methyltransferase [Planctomycetota bacterium]MCH9775106.1 methylated-DNA--[protein]-cysteine S-methyltransferase [Planctomycetota bacterium]MCH9790246.1 methylated-DNA--[protein]-cysteine S-methyltransferase [Planctomycetota bacterium]
MGQSTASVPKAVSGTSHKATVDQSEPLKISVLSTEIGWCGLLGRAETVDRLLIGHHSAADVHQAVKALNLADQVNSGEEIEQENWFPELHERLQDYFQGALVEFQDININLPRLTTFQSRVIRELKKIGYGKSITYGELARKAGAPRAARAVGTVMSSNRIPILIPCHRVIASGGKLGGFSAPQGTSLKQHLLTLEAESFR